MQPKHVMWIVIVFSTIKWHGVAQRAATTADFVGIFNLSF